MAAYYNEFDPQAAAWLRELIKRGLIADGEVDERSIEDVAPADVAGFTQCHFFAGIGGWSLALRLAGWPDDRPVWTGSCPCQPFSAAGKGDGFADERHLWPAFHWIIQQCQPAVVLGEQVASKHADAWIDLVCADLEAMGYAFGAVPFPAAGIGAPHIRDRLYWMADSNGERSAAWVSAQARGYERFPGVSDDGRGEHAGAGFGREIGGTESVRLANADGIARGQGRALDGGRHSGGDAESRAGFGGGGVLVDGRMADANGRNASAEREQCGGEQRLQPEDSGRVQGGPAGPVNGHWRASDWLACRDGKWRPVEPGTQPLAHGIPARVGRLRGYGNAIVPAQAAEFIKAFAGGSR